MSNFPFLPGSPPPCRKGFNPFLTLGLPLAPRKGYSNHPPHTSGPSPKPGGRVLEISQISSLYPSGSLGRSCNDPSLSSASSPPTGRFYQGCLKPPDSCGPKPQLGPPCGKNYCGSPFSSRANVPHYPSSPQEGLHHYCHLPPEAHMSAPGNPYNICLPPGITGFSCSPQSQAPKNSGFQSIFSWETDGGSYFFSDTTTPGPLCSQKPPFWLPETSHCPFSAFSIPSPLDNQFISPPQSPPQRSYNEPPLPLPVCPQVKSPKSPELKQPCAPHRCYSLVIPTQNTPDQLKPPNVSTSPPPPPCSSGRSGPSCMVRSITSCSNSSPKKLPQGTILSTLVPRTFKTLIPTSLSRHLSCVRNHPHGPPIPGPCPLSGSKGPPQCHHQAIVSPCGTCGVPRGPPQPHRHPVGPPCSTHISSFIPSRTPYDPQSSPIARRPRGHFDTMPCGLHVYSVVSRGSHKEPPQIPYSCPLPSSINSNNSTNPGCSSAIVISECEISDSQNKNAHQSRSQSQCESPRHSSRGRSESQNLHLSRSQSRSSSPQHSINEGQSESPQNSKSQSPSESALHSENQSSNKSSHDDKTQGKSKSPHHSRSQSKTPRYGKSRDQSKSPPLDAGRRNEGRSKRLTKPEIQAIANS
ncbi:sperm head and tail associated protein-like [Rhynchonycteris naso]